MKNIQYLLFILCLIPVLIVRQGSKASGKATYRIGFLIFVAGFLVAVAYPNAVTQIANRLDVGRGTDLLIYLTIFALICFTLVVILKFARIEKELTELVRANAINNAKKPKPRK
jgi:small membrane protein